MPEKLLDALKLRMCSHEFSWPRRSPHGDHYQVCLLCATEYKYDWATMRRVERVEPTFPAPPSTAARAQTQLASPRWIPRARRLKLKAAARYRIKNLGSWAEGHTENLSQSGILLRGPEHFPNDTLIEVVFEMPEEISGQPHSAVLCLGRVIRSRKLLDSPARAELAASILDYKFLRER